MTRHITSYTRIVINQPRSPNIGTGLKNRMGYDILHLGVPMLQFMREDQARVACADRDDAELAWLVGWVLVKGDRDARETFRAGAGRRDSVRGMPVHCRYSGGFGCLCDYAVGREGAVGDDGVVEGHGGCWYRTVVNGWR